METRLLSEAARGGCDTIGGLDMLVAQAEDQSEWWIGKRPRPGLMKQAALGAVRLKPDTTETFGNPGSVRL
jgi:shikimate 5-dehydrogenase